LISPVLLFHRPVRQRACALLQHYLWHQQQRSVAGAAAAVAVEEVLLKEALAAAQVHQRQAQAER
jgi:hypothetical protein